MNFIPLAALTSVTNLAGLYALRELCLLGNPCTQWKLYRPYVLAMLPQLQQLVIPYGLTSPASIALACWLLHWFLSS